jgi:hypothetical protein
VTYFTKPSPNLPATVLSTPHPAIETTSGTRKLHPVLADTTIEAMSRVRSSRYILLFDSGEAKSGLDKAFREPGVCARIVAFETVATVTISQGSGKR